MHLSTQGWLSAAVAGLAFSNLCVSAAIDSNLISHLGRADIDQANVILPREKPEWLRILPLGASIVRGLTSTPEDGFRKSLRDKLLARGYKVNMVGSQFNENGSMKDGQHEGHSGHRIDEVKNDMDLSNTTKPNIYLINAGTNDAQQNFKKMSESIDRLRELVEKAFELSPKATVVASTVLPANNNKEANDRVNNLNTQIRDLVVSLKKSNRHVVLAEMNRGNIATSDLGPDGIHPNSNGYQKMATIWDAAIAQAVNNGWVSCPEDTGKPDDE